MPFAIGSKPMAIVYKPTEGADCVEFCGICQLFKGYLIAFCAQPDAQRIWRLADKNHQLNGLQINISAPMGDKWRVADFG